MNDIMPLSDVSKLHDARLMTAEVYQPFLCSGDTQECLYRR